MKKEKEYLKRKGLNLYPLRNRIKNILFIAIILSIVSCKTTKFDTVSETEKINTLMNSWHKNAADANFNDFIELFDREGFYIGTDASEIWTKTQFAKIFKPHFDRKKTWDFKTIKRNIFFSKNKKVAWFNELLDTWMGTCRGSGVFEKEKGTWKLKQYVLSVTVPNSKMKQVIMIKKTAK